MVKALTNRQFFVFVVNIVIVYVLGYFLGLGCAFKKMSKTIIFWLCGIWSFALGLRLFLELTLSVEGIFIPSYPVNLYFDFFILCILGFVTMCYMTKELILVLRYTVKGEAHKRKE